MLKIFKYLRPFWATVLVIIMLLTVQAVCDLTMPDFTSNIVNIGIQQGGIDSSVPKVIRASTFETLITGMNADEKFGASGLYEFIEPTDSSAANYISKYPILANEAVYVRTASMKEVKELAPVFAREIYALTTGTDRDTVIQLPISIVEQSSTPFVLGEYKAIGIDTDKMQIGYILTAGALMLVLAIISMMAVIAVSYLGSKVAASMGKNLRTGVFKKVMSFSHTEMDQFSTASLITRSTNDIQQVQTLIVMLLRVVFYAPIIAIGGIIKVMTTDASLTWIIGIAVVAIMTLVVGLFAFTLPRFRKVQGFVDRVNLVMRENLTGMLAIRAFANETHEEKRFDKANKDLTQNGIKVNTAMAFMMPLMMLIMNAITILIVWNGAARVDAGSMQVGNMMAFIQYTMQIIMSFFMISLVSIMLPRAAVSAGRIDEVLTTSLSITDLDAPVNFSKDSHGLVEFKNVSFKYPGAQEYVLKDINFTAKPGQTTAFIGSTGSGKSTLISLIPRFYDASEGEILIDGVDIKKVAQKSLRDKIGYVPQKGLLFSGTIWSNITYGHRHASEAHMWNIAKIAQAEDFIKAKDEGMESPIAQGGGNVSGGQKQRLSIARAIAKEPDVYIFDDSFSALDFKTDVTLRKALKSQTTNSTVLIVAQRISTILNAEQIIVLDEGQIAGMGTHKELLENCSVYQEIALSQLSKEEL